MTVPSKPVPDCGTDGTPPCPPPNVFFETRALVIDRLAGPGAPWERRRIITAQVDTYLQAALCSTFILIQGLQVQGAAAKMHPAGHIMAPEAADRSRPAPVAVNSKCCESCG